MAGSIKGDVSSPTELGGHRRHGPYLNQPSKMWCQFRIDARQPRLHDGSRIEFTQGNLILSAVSLVDLRETPACSAWWDQLATAALTLARISGAFFIPCCLPNA